MTRLIDMRQETSAPRRAEVSVDGQIIPRADIAREIQNHPASTPDEAWQSAARALVVRRLLLAEAERLALDAAPEPDEDGLQESQEEALIRVLLEHEIQIPRADTATCRRYYEQNARRFRSPDLHEASHILFPAAQDDSEARAAARAQAEEALAALASGAADFVTLARLHSACPSREVGGSLGQIGPGQTVKEFERALAGMREGQVHPQPVESRFGLHVVLLTRRIPGRDLPFEMVEDTITAHLEINAWQAATRQYLSLLAGRAKIKGVALEGASTPLVQ